MPLNIFATQLSLCCVPIVLGSTGFGPINLMFGHTVWGPSAVLGDELKNVKLPDNVSNHVNDFLCLLYTACAIAHKCLSCAKKKMKELFDCKTRTCLYSGYD